MKADSPTPIFKQLGMAVPQKADEAPGEFGKFSEESKVSQEKLHQVSQEFPHVSHVPSEGKSIRSGDSSKISELTVVTKGDEIPEGVLERVSRSSEKIKVVLVDSGMGGGMTAALLKGEVRQLGSYFCLPIGAKKPAQAEAYTAAMALWPLISPLANSEGKLDGKVAEHVVIACNSASVRKGPALALIEGFCKNIFDGGPLEAQKKGIAREVYDNIVELHGKIVEAKESGGNYLDDHIHEIVTQTASSAAEMAFHSDKQQFFIRVDSTDGTAKTGTYPDKIFGELKDQYGSDFVTRIDHTQTSRIDGVVYTVTHTLIKIKNESEGIDRTIVIEGRGNPPWVDAIEGAEPYNGESLVSKSLEASQAAIARLPEDFNDVREWISDSSPDCSMLCCTHYPALKEDLAKLYGEDTQFINQATIVRDIVQEKIYSGDYTEDGPLSLAVTVGSQNQGGVDARVRPSIKEKDGNDKAATLLKVLQTTVADTRPNLVEEAIGSVKIFDQGGSAKDYQQEHGGDIQSLETRGTLQQQFELIHEFLGMENKDKILAEQGLVGSFDEDGNLRLSASEGTPLTMPSGLLEGMASRLPEPLKEPFDGLARLATLGETRGVDKISLKVDVGAQLAAATMHLADIIGANNDKELLNREPVGILTGFTVVSPTGERVEGENDGPPGAVMMAKSLMDRGTPAVLVTDRSSEATLVSALIGAGIVELDPEKNPPQAKERGFAHVKVAEGYEGLFRFEVPDYDNKSDLASRGEQPEPSEAIAATREKLDGLGVKTMISIERPSPPHDDKRPISSMLAADVSAYNLNMSSLLADMTTIGIGDGGNELGTGGVSSEVREGRGPDLKPFVAAGELIGAKADLATDSMILSSVSNNGGVMVSMALDALMAHREGTGEPSEKLDERLTATRASYNDILTHMHKVDKISIDGVNKEDAWTVDGRDMGMLDGETYAEDLMTSGEHTHHDTFRSFQRILMTSV